jgi:hypothetical protein
MLMSKISKIKIIFLNQNQRVMLSKVLIVITLIVYCLSASPTLHAQNANKDGSYKGSYKAGKRSGRGTFTWSDGSKYTGDWENDFMEGYGTLTLPDGSKYQGYWKNGNRDGFGTFTWANGDTYQGQFKDNKRSGDGILKMKDGSEYSGEWENNMANGKGTFTWSNKTKYIGAWKDDKRHGEGVTISASGKIEQGTYKDDVYQPCNCPPEERLSLEDAFKKHDAVFVGKIVNFAGNMAGVKIMQYWKGDVLDEISIAINIGYSSCDWIFFKDETYLFFADKVSTGIVTTALCTRTAKLKDATADIATLEKLVPCIDKNNTAPLTSTMVTGYVCGCDGNSYRSPNEARKSGVQQWKLGLCGNKK